MAAKEKVWHYLAGIKRTTTPERMVVFDTETKPIRVNDETGAEDHALRVWCGKYIRQRGGSNYSGSQHSGEIADSFWQWIVSLPTAKSPVWAFSHNLGFDLTILGAWPKISSGELQVVQHTNNGDFRDSAKLTASWTGLCVLESPPTIIEVRIARTKRTIIFVDTLNYWRQPLCDIGESVGMPKMPMPDRNADRKAWWSYCMGDVEILERAIIGLCRFIKVNDCGPLAYTAASQSMNAFRKRFMNKRILIHANADASDLERSGYFGGDCRCFKVGKAEGPIYHVDVNSLYPYVMGSMALPAGLVAFHESNTMRILESSHGEGNVMSRVLISTDKEPYPTRLNKRLIFAVGEFWTTLCGTELTAAMMKGHVRDSGPLAIYRMDKLFSEYVFYYYQLRMQYRRSGDKAGELYCKTLLNSLYGKFGQRTSQWEETGTCGPPSAWGTELQVDQDAGCFRTFRYIGGRKQMRRPREETGQSFPGLAAWITMLGRGRMNHFRDIARPENVYYQDTDSLFVSNSGYVNLHNGQCIDQSDIGMLKSVAVLAEANFVAQKCYFKDGKLIAAGLKRNAERQPDGSYVQPSFESLESIMKSGDNDTVHISKQAFRINADLSDGVYDADGRWHPIRLSLADAPQ